MEMTISRDRWQLHLKTRGQHYHERARQFEALHARHPTWAPIRGAGLARAGRGDGKGARMGRLTRYQHILLRMGEWIAYAESAGSWRGAPHMAEGKLNEKANDRFDARRWRQSAGSSPARRP
jgi:hypothetical protein